MFGLLADGQLMSVFEPFIYFTLPQKMHIELYTLDSDALLHNRFEEQPNSWSGLVSAFLFTKVSKSLFMVKTLLQFR